MKIHLINLWIEFTSQMSTICKECVETLQNKTKGIDENYNNFLSDDDFGRFGPGN